MLVYASRQGSMVVGLHVTSTLWNISQLILMNTNGSQWIPMDPNEYKCIQVPQLLPIKPNGAQGIPRDLNESQ